MNSYSADLCKQLERSFASHGLKRPIRKERYDVGDHLEYEVNIILPQSGVSRVSLVIDKFVGGGFAGQVYKVRILEIRGATGTFQAGQTYALKIFIPPSRGALFLRNLLYWIGFQGPFQLQVNPAAARAGALWQTFIRRAASRRFSDEEAVNQIHATLIDQTLGSCGEISSWVEGRTWRLEVNDRIDLLALWEKGKLNVGIEPGSSEYRHKKSFMSNFVELLHEIGAHEFARQYEWSTWKSQPNVLKRLEMDSVPDQGLTAVDFRAGLTLLPFLPMSPGDIKLILQGMKRGSLVQFDRGDLKKLETFIANNSQEFTDLLPLLEELKHCEDIYRNSTPDITHNGIRTMFDKSLRSMIMDKTINAWRIKNTIDQTAEERLHNDTLLFLAFLFLGFIPFFGMMIQKAIGRADYRTHYSFIFRNLLYIQKTALGVRIESLIRWHREGRITPAIVEKIHKSFILYLYHVPLSILPIGLHRFFSDREYFLKTLYVILVHPVQLYFNSLMREKWLKEMVEDGRNRQIISSADAQEIIQQASEPYIHKYLQSLAVHILMSPTTHIVAFGLATYFLISHPEMPQVQAYAIAAGIVAFFQLIPVSPGSLSRGLYVLYIVIRERNLKDYSIALFLSFLKYIGYLSFPIQMTYRYPTLARFMAGYWATHTVRFVPVFGESGALLEHKVFTVFYNLPLTMRRKMMERAEKRREQKPRIWHSIAIVLLFSVLGGITEYFFSSQLNASTDIARVSPVLIVSGLISGILINLGSKGASSTGRIILAVISGIGIGILWTLFSLAIGFYTIHSILSILSIVMWRIFISAVCCTVGALIIEFKV